MRLWLCLKSMCSRKKSLADAKRNKFCTFEHNKILFFVKSLYIVLGSITLFLGLLGIFLPILPTTPFLLLTAGLYFKGSDKMYQWLMNHPRLGPYILNYRKFKAVPVKVKVCSISLLWISILCSAILFVSAIWLKILLIFIAIAVTIHILSFKTIK